MCFNGAKVQRATKILLTAVAALMALSCVEDKNPVSIGIGDRLPSFTVRLSDGSEITDRELRGAPSVVTLFCTRCSDCRALLPELQQFYEIVSEDNVPVILIAREEDGESIQAYWDQHGLSLPYSPQNDRSVFNLFAESGIPRVYICDREGYVVYTHDDQSIPTCDMLLKELEQACDQH